MSTIPEKLEEGVFQWVFGDDEVDPGLLVSEGREVVGFRSWLGALETQIGDLKRTLGVSISESTALDRLHALIVEVERAPIVQAHAAAPVVSLDSRRKRIPKAAGIAAAIFAIAAGLFVVLRGGTPKPKDVDVALASALTKDIAMDDEGFGFGGAAEPSPRDRGFLIGAVIDLSKARGSGAPAGEAELELARKLASKALAGLAAPDDREERRQRALGGCAAILDDGSERAACEEGLRAYGAARDAAR